MVNLAEAQKVFNLVQGLSKQQQFVKYISNAGLLSVLLESITKGNGAGATFLVPSPDALQSLPPASPYFNNPALARTTLRYHMILGKQMDYTALVERPADTGFPTLAKESVFKSDESAFFTVVFRSGSGRSTSTLLAPNLAKTEFFQVHLSLSSSCYSVSSLSFHSFSFCSFSFRSFTASPQPLTSYHCPLASSPQPLTSSS
ncbi:unnamed protein product [Closterium sp. Yama58-4]|nr:unnamed protein product [Closterium sp. Yama58-4]